MIYPRLRLARNLLSDDGVIFISIDDNEQANLKKVCDEVFGERNFIAILHWKKKKQPSFLSRVAGVIEYLFVYEKQTGAIKKLAIDKIEGSNKPLINANNSVVQRVIPKGTKVKKDVNVLNKGFLDKANNILLLNEVRVVNGRTVNDAKIEARFRTGQENINQLAKEDLIFFTSNLSLRRDVSEEESSKMKSITDLLLDWGQNQDSDKEQ